MLELNEFLDLKFPIKRREPKLTPIKKKQLDDLKVKFIVKHLQTKSIKEVALNFNLSYATAWRISRKYKCGHIL